MNGFYRPAAFKYAHQFSAFYSAASFYNMPKIEVETKRKGRVELNRDSNFGQFGF
jgi:hypothetical protein